MRRGSPERLTAPALVHGVQMASTPPAAATASHSPLAGPQSVLWVKHGAEPKTAEGTAGSEATSRFMKLITTNVNCCRAVSLTGQGGAAAGLAFPQSLGAGRAVCLP